MKTEDQYPGVIISGTEKYTRNECSYCGGSWEVDHEATNNNCVYVSTIRFSFDETIINICKPCLVWGLKKVFSGRIK